MSTTSSQLNQQIERCASILQSSRTTRRHLQHRLIIRLKTPLLLAGGLLLTVSLVQYLSVSAGSSRAVRSSWLQQLPVWLLGLWQSAQHVRVPLLQRAVAGAGANQTSQSE
ncbi:MAG: hypothetical protein U5L02_15870 [Rheinheimera sp.]|nr:hypothetical protein [Rheinheimera sp.]